LAGRAIQDEGLLRCGRRGGRPGDQRAVLGLV